VTTAWHDEEARSLLADLPPGKDGALLHLLTCPACREWATHRLLQEHGAVEAFPEYDEVFDRLYKKLPRMIEEAGRRRAEIETLLESLLEQPKDQQIETLLEHQLRLQPADLLEASQEAQPGDPKRSEALADLAVELTARLFRGEADESIEALYFTRAAILQGNAHRLLGDLQEAEAALERAAYYLAWPFDSWDRAAFCRTLGLLRWEQGRLDEAAALLRQSARAFSEQYLPEEEGASLTLSGLLCLEQNQTEAAIRLLQTGRAALDPCARSWLTVRSGLSLALAFADIGQKERSAAVLRETWWHYGRVRDDGEQLRIFWLEGRINARLGRRDEAENLLSAVRSKLIGEPNLPETVLCSLDLAALLAETDRVAEVSRLIEETVEAFASEEAALEILRPLCRAFAAETAGARELPSPYSAFAAAATAVRRVFRSQGHRVEGLPFA
jgi:tetratricopeptide (TPR) repeat protein